MVKRVNFGKISGVDYDLLLNTNPRMANVALVQSGETDRSGVFLTVNKMDPTIVHRVVNGDHVQIALPVYVTDKLDALIWG